MRVDCECISFRFILVKVHEMSAIVQTDAIGVLHAMVIVTVEAPSCIQTHHVF